ncbi:holliday junction resolvase (hjc) [Desulfotomaculum arcticum]|uniref:Holliday junction resolvase (Hjc) n=1 Tax=Desulfotruncus arcticus DSM 17038 TaxID=1121424 RepID=A0A1I2YA37_9FIRM|nr:Holliday junction resolvase [Desulfotruncus arcticus]SFH22533.1 holliday junction resolvase (hjc) [Desulfotomaculum arcticum] [Desulfotruncus arcticus DSM 17038]
MARTNYQRGYEVERKIMEQLAEQGFLVLRSAGSHSKIDVLGLRRDRIIAVQSKRTKKLSFSGYKKEVTAIQSVIFEYGLDNVDFELWVWVDRQGFKKWAITGQDIKEKGAS